MTHILCYKYVFLFNYKILKMENWKDVDKRMKMNIEKLFVGTCVILGILFVVFKTIEWVFM